MLTSKRAGLPAETGRSLGGHGGKIEYSMHRRRVRAKPIASLFTRFQRKRITLDHDDRAVGGCDGNQVFEVT